MTAVCYLVLFSSVCVCVCVCVFACFNDVFFIFLPLPFTGERNM